MTDHDTPPEILSRRGGPDIAYHKSYGHAPGIVFLGGFMSDMTGTKATALEAHARARGQAFLRFDYRGHGASGGAFEAGTIGLWRDDAVAALDRLTEGPQILVGSSMGGWIMLLMVLARPQRVAGLVGIAAAPDFTEDLMWAQFTPEIRDLLVREGVYHQPSDYGEAPYPITMTLIEDARDHLLLRSALPIACPVRLLQGMKDADVPWETALRLAERLESEDVEIVLVKNGDHRLSEPGDLRRLTQTLDALTATLSG